MAPTQTSLSQAYSNVHLHPRHIVPIDFAAVAAIPDSHTWPHPMQITSPEVTNSVPVIDFTAPDVGDAVADACRRWGMFQVTNHGVPSTLVSEVEGHARRLFQLPAEQKLRAVRSPTGATGYGMARISPFFPKLMWHEGFTIIGSSVAHHAKLLWPDECREFCDAMDNYQKKMNSLAYKLLLIILKALGVNKDQQDYQEIISSCQLEGALQLNSYPSCPNPSQAIGLAPHTDTSLLTILHQSDVEGLQVFQDEGLQWTSVPPVPGALVVNIGDLMHFLSNGNFPTVCHRVVPSGMQHRLSAAYFYSPPMDSTIVPFAGLMAPRFRPVKVKEYIGLKSKHLDKALPLIRI